MVQKASDIKVRMMVSADLAAVNDIDRSITGKGRVTTWPFSFETYWGIYKSEAIVFVAELNGQVSGFLSGYIEQRKRNKSLFERPHAVDLTGNEERIGWIEMMGIRPEAWHKGIGTLLLEAFRAECQKRNAKIRIVARDDDGDLVSFLRRAGFKRSETVTYELP